VIEAAYRRLARKYHPDANPDGGAAARMAELNHAYETLRDPSRRASYDRQRVAAGTLRGRTRSPSAATRAGARAAGVETVSPPPSEVPVAAPVGVRRIAIACRACRSEAYARGEPIGWPRGENFREGNTLRCTECGRHWRYAWTIDHPAVLDPRRQFYSSKAGKVLWKRRGLFGARLLAALLALVALGIAASVIFLPDPTAAVVADLTRRTAEVIAWLRSLRFG
jgi:curved DNA-binding protein CbpA